MKPFQMLAILLASVLIFSFAFILVKSDALTSEPDYGIPSYLSIREVDVKPIEVTSSQIELNVTTYISYGGGRTRNASMLIRAVNSGTRLLMTQASAPIPETEQEVLDKIMIVSQKLTVDKNSGYELKILLFDNGSIRDSGSVTINGLGALPSSSKQSGIALSNVDFTVSSVVQGNVAIKSDVYLENRGPEASENLNMVVKAREAASNLLADKQYADTGVIPSEATAVKSVQIQVPDNYNYMVVVELWKGDIMINTWEKPVLLAPTKTVPKESIEKKVDLEVSKFVREAAAPPYPMGTPEVYAGPQAPGFGILGAITVLLIVLVLRRRL